MNTRCIGLFLVVASGLGTPVPAAAPAHDRGGAVNPALLYWKALATAATSRIGMHAMGIELPPAERGDAAKTMSAPLGEEVVDWLQEGASSDARLDWGLKPTADVMYEIVVHTGMIPALKEYVFAYAEEQLAEGNPEEADRAIAALLRFGAHDGSTLGVLTLDSALILFSDVLDWLEDRDGDLRGAEDVREALRAISLDIFWHDIVTHAMTFSVAWAEALLQENPQHPERTEIEAWISAWQELIATGDVTAEDVQAVDSLRAEIDEIRIESQIERMMKIHARIAERARAVLDERSE